MKYILIIMMMASASLGATYYVKTGGNDASAGTSDGTAWETLNGISEQSPAVTNGDIICLNRDDTWAEDLGTGDLIAGVTYKDYGTGALPIIQRG